MERYRSQGKDKSSSPNEAPKTGRPLRVAVVGGGAGGVEVALSLQFRLEHERIALGLPDEAKAQIT